MVRFLSSKPKRSRSDRARRRVLFSAESLESRQLLSVAAMQPAIAPAIHGPAAFGPVVPSTGNTVAPNGGTFGFTPAAEITIPIVPTAPFQASSHGISEIIIVIEEPIATGAAAAAPPPGPISSTGGNTNSPTQGAGAGVTLGNDSITPLTAAVLAGPAGANQAAVLVVIAPQPVVFNFGSSTIPATTQAILNTATLEEQPLPPPVLGQGFESGQTQGLDPRTEGLLTTPRAPVPLRPMLPAIDYIEPFQPEAAPAPPAQPEQLDEAPPAPVPVRNVEPAEAVLVEPAETVPVEPAILTDWDTVPEFPILSPTNESRTQAEAPSWSMAAMIGTAAIAGGGYHIVLSGSNRFNQRWLPTRDSERTNRGRRSEEN